MSEKIRNSIEFRVHGKYALFSDPITRAGGEKFSYQVPTYQALKGICESIYWKPTFVWVIDKVRVMKMIQTESKGIRPIKYAKNGNDLSHYTYLKDVSYQVIAHFEWNEIRKNLEKDRDENKHHNIAKRCLEKGGRRDIFLGTRECQGYVEPCLFGEEQSIYDQISEINFGLMFHGFNYPDETPSHNLEVRFAETVMKNGIIEFMRPEDVKDVRTIRENLKIKEYILGTNLSLAEDEKL